MEGGENSSSNCVYRECLRNHAASLGSYATDGCGEFTIDDTSPACLQCVACGCHRNFHRKLTYPPTHHHHHHPRGRDRGGGDGGHHLEMKSSDQLIDYGGGGSEGRQMMVESAAEQMSKKRFRSKFTADQREKMLAFAEKLGWKLQRKDLEDEIERFCGGIGVSRQVFKVWMHNHKNSCSSSSASTGNASSLTHS